MFDKVGILKLVNNEQIAQMVRESNLELFVFVEVLSEILDDVFLRFDNKLYPLLPIDMEEASSETKRRVLAMCLLIKAMNTIESMVILAEKGLESDCRVLCRSIFETIIRLRAICQFEDYYLEYVGYDLHEGKMFLKSIKRHEEFFLEVSPPEVSSYTSENAQELGQNIEKKIEEGKLPQGKTNIIAERLGLRKDYDFVYGHLSIDAHATPKSLLRYMEREDDILTNINVKSPELDKLGIVVFTGLMYFLEGLKECIDLFDCGRIESFDNYFQKFILYYRGQKDNSGNSE